MTRQRTITKPCCRICAHWNISLGCQHEEAQTVIVLESHAKAIPYEAAYQGNRMVGVKPNGHRIYRHNPCGYFKGEIP